VATGLGKGRYFTQLGWAREQFIDKLGIDPFPGTLNVIIDDAKSLSAWTALKSSSCVRIDSRVASACAARCFPVSIRGEIAAAIVLPEVQGYPPKQIEIIASIQLRKALGVEDGDRIGIAIMPVPGNP
jgi:CTP-dependent riboflavin kinase